MDVLAILSLVGKGLSVAETLYEAGKNALPAIKTVAKLVTGAQQGTVTSDELTETERALDAMIADFNEPLD